MYGKYNGQQREVLTINPKGPTVVISVAPRKIVLGGGCCGCS